MSGSELNIFGQKESTWCFIPRSAIRSWANRQVIWKTRPEAIRVIEAYSPVRWGVRWPITQ